MSDHALLSASGAHKWLHCTPSARLEEPMPETESDYTKEGRLAHEIGELKLRKAFIEPMGQRTFNNKLKKLKENPMFQEEMLKYTDDYLNYVYAMVHEYSTTPYIAVEKRFNYSAYAPEGFGTGDCTIIGGNTLNIIDLKYGKGVSVSAEDNPQMKLYALGAYMEYGFLYPIENVKMVIVQPRLDNISESTISINDLLAWGESIKPIAQTAFEGKGDFVPGEHCRFCRAKALCRARTEFNTSLEEFHMMKPPLISDEEVGQILAKAQDLAKWAKDLEEYALNRALSGGNIPGWKAVEGRSNRQFTDQDVAFNILKLNGIDEAMLYERKPLTLAATEKLVGAAKFKELLESYIVKSPGKPTLAPLSDKREPLNRSSAAEDFGNS